MFAIDKVREKLQNGDVSAGSWITIGSSDYAEMMCNLNFDWLLIDLEHTGISVDKCLDLIRVVDSSGIAPIVRLPSQAPALCKRVLDMGAQGIMIPDVRSADQAESAVKMVKYQPLGTRGVGLGRAQNFGEKFDAYYSWQKARGPLVICQIEHREALEEISLIAATEGVDVLFVGPYDLSSSLGIPGEFEDEKYQESNNKFLECCKKSSCAPGIHSIEADPDGAERAWRDGYQFIGIGVDFKFFGKGLSQIKKILEDEK